MNVPMTSEFNESMVPADNFYLAALDLLRCGFPAEKRIELTRALMTASRGLPRPDRSLFVCYTAVKRAIENYEAMQAQLGPVEELRDMLLRLDAEDRRVHYPALSDASEIITSAWGDPLLTN